ncbi:dipeptidase [Plantactinospora sp. GCM10030261]|uniref:dipeptidase n=1 Tax=Plantactinospora sp. GCM10030261 TaxID=3273420 RepID=UPI00361FA5B4
MTVEESTQPTVWDGHNDLVWELRDQAGYDLDKLDVGRHCPSVRTDLPRLRAGGVGAQFWSVFVPSSLAEPAAVVATLEQIDGVRRLVDRYPNDLALATTADEATGAMSAGRIASLLGAEGGHSIGSSLGVLRGLYALGVRYLTLTHNDNTLWADSATDIPAVGGLSPFGVEVVREMNRIGMIVDLSHVHERTMRAALAATRAPVMFSHSSARALCDVPRNVPDDVLAAIRGNGGVCMVTFVPEFVTPGRQAWRDRRERHRATLTPDEREGDWRAGFLATDPAPVCTIDHVVRHVEHVREVAGVDHVGIGGDYDGADSMPDGLADVSGYPRLFAALRERGWSAVELAKLAHGNMTRVLRAVEDAAS